MKLISSLILVLLGLLAYTTALTTTSTPIPDGIQISSAQRLIDISRNFEEQIVDYRIDNKGDSGVSYFLVPIHADKSNNIALVEASVSQTVLTVTEVQVDDVSAKYIPESTRVFRIDLPSTLAPKASVTVRVTSSYTHTLTPFPESIRQSERQLMMYRDSVYVYALQTVSTQATRVRLFSSAVESYTPVKHAALASNTLTFGPYDRPVAALTPGSALSVHAENNAPFATMRAATREFRVSHWGHVNVEENYLLAHTGAKLRGEFLRSAYEGHIPAARGQHAFERLAMFLPLAATDISFRDAIGNVSTSHVRPEPVHRRTLVELRTRYPLFGGWTADLEVGYRLPVQDVLSAVPGSEDLVLELPFGLPLEGVAADELAVRVVLPEGAADIRWDTPFDVDGVSEGTVMTSLDTAGRPVLEIRKVNVVAGHWKPFRVAYRFPRVQLWREPMLLVLAVFLVLGLVMVWVRLDFSIGGAVETEDDDEVVQEQEKVVAKKETKSEAKKADQGKHRSDKKKK